MVFLESIAGGAAAPVLPDVDERAARRTLRAQIARLERDLGAAIVAAYPRQEEARLLIERMLLDPGRYRWVRVANADIGEPGCKHWHVRPRLGLIGMLAGWWHVKISSGCPLAP